MISPSHFIDWNQLPLPAAAQWLAEKHSGKKKLDMTSVIIVVPTARSKRRIRELLLQYAANHKLVFTPPQVTTIGTFPELLYVPQKPLASALTQTLAWVKALKNVPTNEIRYFTNRVPAVDDSLGWRTLADVISKWHVELAGNRKTFTDVLKAGEKNTFFTEQKRWQTLVSIQRKYLDVLHEEGLWDRQTARLMAIKYEECEIDKQVYMLGTVDLNLTSRAMLEQIGPQVTPIIFSNPEFRDYFDELGCLKIEPWESQVIPVNDKDVAVGGQPEEQAKLLAHFLAQLDGEFSVDQISISIPDPSITSPISRSLMACDVKTHDVSGSSISHNRVFILLELLSAWLDGYRFEDFATLVRHPDIFNWLCQQTGSEAWLGELDAYQNHRLPFSIPVEPQRVNFYGNDRRGEPRYGNLEQAWEKICEWVLPLTRTNAQPLEQWSEPWQFVLRKIYETTEVDRNAPENRRTIRACQAIVKSFVQLEEYGQLLDGTVSSAEAALWALDLCSNDFVIDVASPEALSLIGWLDTALEDTPVTAIAGVNEGFIPSSDNSGLFLPNSIRSDLDLVDNRRRYVRDVYSLMLILASREKVFFTVGRRDGEGQPLLPSRLLLTGEPTDVAKRCRRLFGAGDKTDHLLYGSNHTYSETQQFPIPDLQPHLKPVSRLRVTDFKQYLNCPYRFFLGRILNLQTIADNQQELDGGQFGSLIHDVAESFGRSKIKNSDDPEQIAAFFLAELKDRAAKIYGREALPTVDIQLEQAKTRLRALAKWQADHRKKGYEIFEVEREKTQCEFEINGKPFIVSGQIDRIDIHHAEKRIGLYDYKTGDQAVEPRKMHQDSSGNWKDLQLPLYHDLLKSFGLPEEYEVETGIILVTKDLNEVKLKVADWTKTELEDARQSAIDVMTQVQQGVFWPPKEINTSWDDYAAICQTKVFEKWNVEREGATS